jgi:alpha-L-rhamnosidase
MRKHPLFVYLIAAFVSPLSGQVSSKPWTAQWITSATAPARGEAVLHFRRVIDLTAKPDHFLVDVSADNQFILLVNQQRAGSGPSRSDLKHWRYESYDIAPLLRAGRNVLAATVWNFGPHAALAQMSDRIGFLVHGQGEAEHLADTDASWEVAQENAVTALRPDVPGYYAAEPGERLDGAAFDWNWAADSISDKRWSRAETLSLASLRGEPDSHNSWWLVSDPLPPMEMKLVAGGHVVRSIGVQVASEFPAAGVTIPPHTTAAILFDNSELTTAYPDLKVSGGLGAVVRLTYAEALVDATGRKGNRDQIDGKHIVGVHDEFLPGGCSSCEFVPLTWRTWRYLQLDVKTEDQPLEIESLRAWFTAFPFAQRGYFHSDDAALGKIWDIGWRTARLDAHDTYMDTPYWERLQYIGDTRIQALISYAVAADDRLARQAIEAFNNSRIAEGLTQSRYPSSLVQMIPTFSLLWVGMVHDFWMYRGDENFVRRQLSGTRAVMDWFLEHQRPDGLLGKIPWWPFVDWGKDFNSGEPPQDTDGGSSVITLQFVEALRYASDLEQRLGDAGLAAKYRTAADRAAQAILRSCWNEQYGLLADTPAQKHFSQHANILGVWLDVIPKSEQRIVLAKILSASSDAGFVAPPVPPMTSATYYFRFYLARAIEHTGMGNDYLNLLGPWKQMIGLGLTTWAESPEPTRSDSHAWSAHPNYDLLTIVAGIRPAKPGFDVVLIEPHLGNLKHVSAAMPTPKGNIEVEYSRQGNNLQAEVTLPTGVSGEFVWNGKASPLREGKQEMLVQ